MHQYKRSLTWIVSKDLLDSWRHTKQVCGKSTIECNAIAGHCGGLNDSVLLCSERLHLETQLGASSNPCLHKYKTKKTCIASCGQLV